jgi:hypothetical protein
MNNLKRNRFESASIGRASFLCVPQTLKFLFPFRHQKVLVLNTGRLKVISMGLTPQTLHLLARILDPSVVGNSSLETRELYLNFFTVFYVLRMSEEI